MYLAGQHLSLGMHHSSCDVLCFSISVWIVYFVAIVLSGAGLPDIGAKMWGTLAVTSLIGSCSQFSMTIGMQHEKSARATLMRMSDIIGGFLWQALFTKDALDIFTLSGMADVHHVYWCSGISLITIS
jgi:drug/metabolite transporter (DMT)-like permease